METKYPTAVYRDDETKLRVDFGPGPHVFTADELQKVIHDLAAHRMNMKPQVTMDPIADATAFAGTVLAAQPDRERGGVVMAARHPGYGWLYLHVPDQIARGMSGLSQSPPADSGTQKH